MPNFKVLSHFRLRKWLSKIKKRVLTPSFPQPTSSSKWVGEPDYIWGSNVVFTATNYQLPAFLSVCTAASFLPGRLFLLLAASLVTTWWQQPPAIIMEFNLEFNWG